MIHKNFLFALMTCMLFFTTSCTKQQEVPGAEPLPQASQVASTQVFHSLMPGTLTNVYQMNLTRFTDGSYEVTRHIVPFDGNVDYENFFLIGSSSANEVGGSLQVHFNKEAWFIPFDPQSPPVKAIKGGGGDIDVDCWCTGFGGCNAKASWGADGSGSAECVSRDCTGNCNMEIELSSKSLSEHGVLVATQYVAAL